MERLFSRKIILTTKKDSHEIVEIIKKNLTANEERFSFWGNGTNDPFLGNADDHSFYIFKTYWGSGLNPSTAYLDGEIIDDDNDGSQLNLVIHPSFSVLSGGIILFSYFAYKIIAYSRTYEFLVRDLLILAIISFTIFVFLRLLYNFGAETSLDTLKKLLDAEE